MPTTLSHAALSAGSERPPGMPPSTCQGAVERIIVGDNRPIDRPNDDPTIAPVMVPAQAGEGDVNNRVPMYLYGCKGCGHRISVVLVSKADRVIRRIRNDFLPGAPDPPEFHRSIARTARETALAAR